MSNINFGQSVITPFSLGPSSLKAGLGGVIDLTPKTSWVWADELTFYIIVQAVNGSPTSGTLVPKFQVGTLFSSLSVNSGNQYSASALTDLDTAQKGFLIVDGEDWAPIPYNVTIPTSGYIVKRTIKNFGDICNLRLDASSLAGGTNPTFTVAVNVVAKGN